jgi:hypothetical protein
MNRRSVGMAVVVLVCALVGCGEDGHYPPGPGGGPGGGGGTDRIDADVRPDAEPSDAAILIDAAAGFAGRLCDLVDLRQPLDCSGANLSGIDVVDPDSRASDLTDADGNFRLDVQLRADLALAVGVVDDDTRDAVVAAGMWDGGRVDAPRISQTSWDDLLVAIGAAEELGTASIVLYVRDRDGDPVAGAEVTPPAGAADPYYDTVAAEQWAQGEATGAFGAAILLSVPADGAAQLSVDLGAGAPRSVTVPVQAGMLSWARLTAR